MKNLFRISAVILLIFLIHSCNKEKPKLPTLTTTDISTVTQNTAISGGNITNDGGALVIARGVCWNTSNHPTIANSKTLDDTGTGNFTSSITGLTLSTKYYLCAYATNSAGTAYGNEQNFTTTSITATDNDGNVYNTVTIGTQVWMKENLKTTKFNDGTSIPLVGVLVTGLEWRYLTTPGYCWYNNNEGSYKNTYGALYNWHTVNTGKLCPVGWHVPTDSEWSTLTTYIGGAAGKLKEAGTAHWSSPNTGATNETGFTALPGGDRYFGGSYEGAGNIGYWWSSTGYSTMGIYRAMNYFTDVVGSGNDMYKEYGFSVRCLKN